MKSKEQAGKARRSYHHGGGTHAMTIQEFGLALGVNPFTVRRQIEARQLKSFQFGRRILIPRTELDRILGSADR